VSDVASSTPAAHPLSGRGLIASAWWMTGSHLVAQAFAYGSLILLARWLPPASFGTVAVGTAIVYIAVFVVDRGTWGGIVVRQQLSRVDLARAFRGCMLTALVLAAVMAASAGVLADSFASGGDAAVLAVLAISLPLHAVAVVPTALLQKSMQFRRLAGVNAVANVLSAAVAVLVALAGLGVWALVARQLVLFGVTAVLASVMCLPVLRAHQPTPKPESPVRQAPSVERWFFLFTVMFVLISNLDYLVIGGFTDAGVVGLYVLALTIAMAPSTHFSEQVGKVLFAAAASQPETSRDRTEQSVKLMSMLLVPLVPIGILVAPTVLPAVFGAEWKPAVVAFQVLFVVGVGHAIVNCIGEALSGNGQIAWRAKVMVARCVATLLALVVLVAADGIRGAALAQLLVFAPYAALYVTAGARRAGTSPAALWRTLRPVLISLGVQVAVSVALLVALTSWGWPDSGASCAAAAVGFVACVPVQLRTYVRMRS
jgi:O-antigen/teichoic acid export membrane protein